MNEKQIDSIEMEELFEGILTLKSSQECKQFFRDLCTLSELEAMAERFQVAKRVDREESYRTISQKTGSSTATVTRVAYWLHNGLGGYKLVLGRLRKKLRKGDISSG